MRRKPQNALIKLSSNKKKRYFLVGHGGISITVRCGRIRLKRALRRRVT
jgi:hypothetical protein